MNIKVKKNKIYIIIGLIILLIISTIFLFKDKINDLIIKRNIKCIKRRMYLRK
jgi:hypothetical protein